MLSTAGDVPSAPAAALPWCQISSLKSSFEVTLISSISLQFRILGEGKPALLSSVRSSRCGDLRPSDARFHRVEMKLLVAWACVALTGLQTAESGSGQPWQWTQQPGKPGAPQPSGQPQVPGWWQGAPAGQAQRQPSSLQQLPGAAGAPYQQPGAGGFPQFQNFQGASQMQQMPGMPAAPSLQQLPGVSGPASIPQLNVPASAQLQQASGVPTPAPVQQFAGGPGAAPLMQLPGAAGGPPLPQLGGGGGSLPLFPGARMHSDVELVQQRTRVPAGGVAASASLGSSGVGSFGQAAQGGTWRDSNTYAAIQELHAQVVRLFQRQGGEPGWAYGGAEVAVPVENLTNVLVELSKLIPAVIVFCETERMQKGPQVDPLQGAGMHAAGRNVSFPADQFVVQGMAYARKVTAQLRALRDLLTSVLAPSASKETLTPEIKRFKSATADLKDVYQLGSQVASAAVGAVLPYVSSCSFFVRGESENTYKLWSLVSARFSSTLRYIYHVLAAVRSASSKLGELVSGEVQPRSLLDFSRLRPLSKAASHLKTAEARSASAVIYFNDLAAAYKRHTQLQAEGGSDLQRQHIGEDLEEAEKPLPEEDAADNAELSLMADDLLDGEVPHPRMKDDDHAAILQTVQEEERGSPDWHGGEDEDRMLQTVEDE
ncbi:hypothetical protein Emed_000093 [Eimeria media]